MIAVLVALAAGYLIGRWRPFDRLDTWVWRRFTFGGDWTRTRRGQVLTLAAHALVRPRVTVYAWRHRNDPPPPKSPPLRFRSLTAPDTTQEQQ